MTLPFHALPLYVEPVAAPGQGARSVGARALVFRHAGRLHVTVMAKVALDLVQDRAMRIAESAPPFFDGDVLDPAGFAVAATDARPLLRRADVTFIGQACSPSASPARRMLVRLAIVRPLAPNGPLEGGIPLIDKSLGIIGQRFATAAQPNPFPTPFVRTPITYAHALGGPNDPQNPVGTGREADAAGMLRLPSVVPAGEGGMQGIPLGFGPIAKHWPARARLGVEPHLDAITDLADDLDFELFQSAPLDQRVDLLRGDEWIYLENLHPRFPKVVTRLPALASEARVESEGGVVQRLPLRIDGLRILGDEGRAEITCSGAFAVEDEQALVRLSLSAAVTANGEAPAWPLPRDRRHQTPGRAVDFSSTLVIDIPSDPRPSRPGTMVLDPAAAAQATGGGGALPFADQESEEGPSTQVFSSSMESQRMTSFDSEGPASTHAPFRLSKPRSRPNADVAPIPGAPWDESAPPAVRPATRPGIEPISLGGTMPLPPQDPLPPVVAPAPVVAPPVSKAVPSRAAPKKAGGDIWAKPDPSAALPPTPPKPKAAVPAPAVKKNTLYERFKKS